MWKTLFVCLTFAAVLLAQDGPSLKVKRGAIDLPHMSVAAAECVYVQIGVNGARPGDYTLGAWPELGPHTIGTMFVQRADVVEARVCALKPSFVQAGRWKVLVIGLRSADGFDSSLLIE